MAHSHIFSASGSERVLRCGKFWDREMAKGESVVGPGRKGNGRDRWAMPVMSVDHVEYTSN